jgi:hypothetical protein
MELIDFSTLFCFINALLSLSLMYVYLRNYLKMRMPFTLGLLIFASVFLIQNLVAIYFQFAMIMYYTAQVANIALILNLLETVALLSLCYVTYKS